MTKRTILLAALFMALIGCCRAQQPLESSKVKVRTGIEVLRDRGFDILVGKRVGLVTNPTGVDSRLKSTVDILFEAPEVNLVALFGPEHGVRGDVYAGAKIVDGIDSRTGLHTNSLYGKTRKPTKEMLQDIDVLVYDIQDNGCRSYTFISTLGMLMEACAEENIELVVLDRPNPLGGRKIEGCLAENGYISFVSQFKIPYLYAQTVGELALMLNAEAAAENAVSGKGVAKDGALSQPCRLTVVPMKGWNRDMKWEDTGLEWVVSSPHVQTGHTAYFYPMTGIIGEFGYFNIGVGYTLPFELWGAPWIDADKLAGEMNQLNMPGILFRPICFKPFYGTLKDQNLQGVQIHLIDYNKANLTEVQFRLLEVLHRMYPEHVFFEECNKERFRMFDQVCGTGFIRKKFSATYNWEDCRNYWEKDIDSYRERSSAYYLYE